MRIRMTWLLAAGALFLAGCGGADSDSALSEAPAATDAAATGGVTAGTPSAQDQGEAQSDGSGAGGGAAAPPADFGRKLVINANLTVETADVGAAVQRLSQIALEHGGAVFNSEVSLAGEARGTVTLRVPPNRMGDLRTSIAALGKVVAQGQSTADVTDEYVDLEARITAAQASVDRVLGFYEKATDVKELTALESELTRRQADLESLLGKRRVLADRVSLATMIVELFEPAKAPEPNAATTENDPTVAGAFKGGVRGLWLLITWIGIVIAALLPILVLGGIVGYPLWRVLRSRPRPTKPRPNPTSAYGAVLPPPTPATRTSTVHIAPHVDPPTTPGDDAAAAGSSAADDPRST